VSDFDSSLCGGAPLGSKESNDVQELIARAQGLVDTPRPFDGYPLTWQVEAAHVGDIFTIAVTALRASDS